MKKGIILVLASLLVLSLGLTGCDLDGSRSSSGNGGDSKNILKIKIELLHDNIPITLTMDSEPLGAYVDYNYCIEYLDDSSKYNLINENNVDCTNIEKIQLTIEKNIEIPKDCNQLTYFNFDFLMLYREQYKYETLDKWNNDKELKFINTMDGRPMTGRPKFTLSVKVYYNDKLIKEDIQYTSMITDSVYSNYKFYPYSFNYGDKIFP
jgi:hypothetical protein